MTPIQFINRGLLQAFIPPQDLARRGLHGSRRKPAGGDNGRNDQAGKPFYIFPPEQRRAYHDHDHDQRRHADLLQGLGKARIRKKTLDVMRVHNGKITDRWGGANLLSLAQKLGLVPALDLPKKDRNEA
jgi:hypothetical protein